MSASLTFVGAAGTVTGSKFLLQSAASTVLVDAGLFQGLRELRRRNWAPFPVDPSVLDAVVLSHAHLDHSGYLPALGRQGLSAPVFASEGTRRLGELVLRDSARLQEEDAQYATRKGFSKHARPRPLYDTADVERVLPLIKPVAFGQRTAIAPDAQLTLQPAGHILGSATPLVELAGRRVLFSGDLGHAGHPILLPPPAPPAADVVVVESTYGDRSHATDATQRLARVIRDTQARGGSILIPAFAVDRTEVLLLALRQMRQSGLIPPIPVYVDSPMALGALQIYRQAIAEGWPEIRPDITGGEAAFDAGELHEARSVADSIAINDLHRPIIIISASGMATGGRVVHHLEHMLPDPRHTVVLPGYQAVGTRGRDLAEGVTQVKIHGGWVRVRARVEVVEGFSVHADADELLAWLARAGAPARMTYVVHGEPEASAALARRIAGELGWPVRVPRDGEAVQLP
jgi:metallo-beta-lactamase family protein